MQSNAFEQRVLKTLQLIGNLENCYMIAIGINLKKYLRIRRMKRNVSSAAIFKVGSHVYVHIFICKFSPQKIRRRKYVVE